MPSNFIDICSIFSCVTTITNVITIHYRNRSSIHLSIHPFILVPFYPMPDQSPICSRSRESKWKKTNSSFYPFGKDNLLSVDSTVVRHEHTKTIHHRTSFRIALSPTNHISHMTRMRRKKIII